MEARVPATVPALTGIEKVDKVKAVALKNLASDLQSEEGTFCGWTDKRVDIWWADTGWADTRWSAIGRPDKMNGRFTNLSCFPE